jgi:hypothetical protein
MARKVSRRIVIDASVARAAGTEESVHPTGKNCREFLKSVLHVCHSLVMTPDLKAEWAKHQSSFTRKWRLQMMARKKHISLEVEPAHSIGDAIGKLDVADSERAKMGKDSLLIDAALASDKSVISLDDTVRGLFAAASKSLRELRQIVWVNPNREDEQPVQWLQQGAKPERKRMLGNRA